MRRVAGTVLLGIAGLACGGTWGGSITLTHELTGPSAEAARALGQAQVDGRFPEDVAGACGDNGATFLWLAARSEDAPVRVAALAAAAGCAGTLDRTDALAVAVGLLDDPVDAVVGADLRLAGALLATEPADSPLGAAVAELARSGSAEARYDAIQALDHANWTNDAGLTSVFLEALGAEQPWLVAEALRLVRFRTLGLADPAPFAAAAGRLTSDPDPGVRGRAAQLLARISGDQAATRARLVELLADPAPYTRAATAEALGELTWPSAAHALLPLVEDRADAVWEMRPFLRLDGETEVPRHTVSLFERVDDAALRALARDTAPMGEEAYVYRDINLRYLDLDIIAAGRDAKRWYEAHRASIPPIGE